MRDKGLVVYCFSRYFRAVRPLSKRGFGQLLVTRMGTDRRQEEIWKA